MLIVGCFAFDCMKFTFEMRIGVYFTTEPYCLVWLTCFHLPDSKYRNVKCVLSFPTTFSSTRTNPRGTSTIIDKIIVEGCNTTLVGTTIALVGACGKWVRWVTFLAPFHQNFKYYFTYFSC